MNVIIAESHKPPCDTIYMSSGFPKDNLNLKPKMLNSDLCDLTALWYTVVS